MNLRRLTAVFCAVLLVAALTSCGKEPIAPVSTPESSDASIESVPDSTTADTTQTTAATAATAVSTASTRTTAGKTVKKPTAATTEKTTAATQKPTSRTKKTTAPKTTLATTAAPVKRIVSEQLAGLFDGTYTEEIAEVVGSPFYMHFPDFLWIGDTIYAYYISYPAEMEGRPCLGVATSKDGINFKVVDRAIIVAGPEEHDARMASFAGVWYDDGTVYLVYESAPYGQGADIALATSTDGIHFKKKGIILYKDTSLGWQNINIGTPDLFKKDGTWYLTFHGFGSDGSDCQIGLAYGDELMLGQLTVVKEPIIPTSKNPADLDSGTTGRRDVIYDDESGYFYMIYEVSTDMEDGSFDRAFWNHRYARSKDFLHWETVASSLRHPNRGYGYDGPCFLEIGGELFAYMRNVGNSTTRIKIVKK